MRNDQGGSNTDPGVERVPDETVKGEAEAVGGDAPVGRDAEEAAGGEVGTVVLPPGTDG